VVFHSEFTLGSSGDIYPPGDYIIETAETRHSAGGHTAHVHRSTLLIVPTLSGTRAVPVDSGQLEAAMNEDAQGQRPETAAKSLSTGNTTNASSDLIQAQLEQHGIARIPADVFVWEGYRYSNAADAIAAAKRGK